ncbi:MAG: 3-deoxy-manno-octulosonate cytidylyltransferase [Deltaproteobacteria bacterium]|nr:3-deoxy-manno-octulosonate cytidylyltransferase [Deltaproteobacteria bacterium]
MSKEKQVIAMIPARMASTRFPGKPLADICGKTMIEHVWQRTRMNKKVASVFIVTCDREIRETAMNFGADVVMTSDKHERCTERIAEACGKLLDEGKEFDVVLVIQGDEPLLNPAALDLLIQPFSEDEQVSCVNLIELLESEDEIRNRNNVKTVSDPDNFVLYFSRLPIPDGATRQHYKQLGIYGLRKEVVVKYSKMKQTPLEIAESVDMMRFIEHRVPIKAVLSPFKTYAVDTPSDREVVCAVMEKDALFLRYQK